MINSLPRSSGIYKILCTANGKVYIGSSLSIRKRCETHRYQFRTHKHKNNHLQNAWDLYGEQCFLFEVIELVGSDMLIEREQYYVDLYKSHDKRYGFNHGKVVEAPMKGQKLPPEAVLKMRNARLGTKQSPETIEKRAASMRGRKRSPEFCEKLRVANLGKKAAPEARKKMSLAKLGRPLSDKAIQASIQKRICNYLLTTPNGEEVFITGLKPFCKQHNLSSGSMCEVASGKRRQYKGWKCRKISDAH